MGRAGKSVSCLWLCLAGSAALLLTSLFFTLTPQPRPYLLYSIPNTSQSNLLPHINLEAVSHGNQSQEVRSPAIVNVNDNSTFARASKLREDAHLGSSVFTITNSTSTITGAIAKQENEVKGEIGREERSSAATELKRVERDLAKARWAIQQAVKAGRNGSSNVAQVKSGFVPSGVVYRNPLAFHQSYLEMEKRFKVWTYREGEPPLIHDAPLNNVYSTEGQFIDEMDAGKSPFSANSPAEVHAFFLPFSVAKIKKFLYKPKPFQSLSRAKLQHFVTSYVTLLSNKYPYWNRTHGADHFMVSCHDWAPDVTEANPELYKNLIRVLCNANTSHSFKPDRDVTLPEINTRYGQLPQLGKVLPPSQRPILAFFAGRRHGHIRKFLFKRWKEKDKEVQVYEELPSGVDYSKSMASSKFCLCPSGWEVASPRVVEAIYTGCVPVIISDHYVLPFSDVLDWSTFSINIPVGKIPEIKTILLGIPEKRYLMLHKRVLQVRIHFVLNRPATRYDLNNMVLHSIWLRRLNLRFSSSSWNVQNSKSGKQVRNIFQQNGYSIGRS